MINIFNPLSTLQASLMGRRNIARVSAELQKASTEVSTGFRADIYGDLGQRAALSLSLRGLMDRTDAFATSNGLLGNKLEVIATSAGQAHDAAQTFLSLAVANLDQPGATAGTLQQQARAAIEAITGALNVSYAGDNLFSGTATDRTALQGYATTNPATGVSPKDVVDGVVGAGPGSAADASAKIAELDKIFASTNTANPAQNFEATFYGGTPALNAGGNPNPRVSARIAEGQTVDYGIQANDPAVRDILKGLTMIASTDVSKIGNAAAYKTWMKSAVGALSDGVAGLTQAVAQLGSQQKLVETTQTQQADLKTVYNNRIVGYEAVDPYEAASRMSALQTQLSAAYSATSQLSKLSLLNYI